LFCDIVHFDDIPFILLYLDTFVICSFDICICYLFRSFAIYIHSIYTHSHIVTFIVLTFTSIVHYLHCWSLFFPLPFIHTFMTLFCYCYSFVWDDYLFMIVVIHLHHCYFVIHWRPFYSFVTLWFDLWVVLLHYLFIYCYLIVLLLLFICYTLHWLLFHFIVDTHTLQYILYICCWPIIYSFVVIDHLTSLFYIWHCWYIYCVHLLISLLHITTFIWSFCVFCYSICLHW